MEMVVPDKQIVFMKNSALLTVSAKQFHNSHLCDYGFSISLPTKGCGITFNAQCFLIFVHMERE
ncbi:MAG: hypothetical protein C4330_07735 [Chitinophagaceae bacterium]